MKRIELHVHGPDAVSWTPCDAMMATVFLNPEIVVSSKKWLLTIELSDADNRRAQLYDSSPNGTEVTVIQQMNQEMFEQILLDSIAK